MNYPSGLIKAVEQQMQPLPRAKATAGTLKQLLSYLPDNFMLSDLVAAWLVLANPQESDTPAVTQRRKTCAELAAIAAPFTQIEHARQAWQVWRDTFQDGNDPRHISMAETFDRELHELQTLLLP